MCLTGHWESAEVPFGLQFLCLCDGCARGQNDGVKDEAVLIALHLPDHLSLVIGWAVVVNDSQTTEQSHVDSHVMFGHRVHGGREEWGLDGEPPGHLGIQGNVRC